MPFVKAQNLPKPASEESVAASTSQPRTKSAAIDILPRNNTKRSRLPSESAASPGSVEEPFEPSRPCCCPLGCSRGNISQVCPPDGAVKMNCNNPSCPNGHFMHHNCYSAFEETLLAVLKTSSRARNWTDKQRKQNMWTKRGYDLIFKAATCRCKKGNLRKDLDYAPQSEDKLKRMKRKSETKTHTPAPVPPKLSSSTGSVQKYLNGTTPKQMMTSRSSRNSDSVLSDVSSVGPTHFRHRSLEDYGIFQELLPKHLVNSFHIKMEDDGYGAGDDTRSFVLSNLAANRIDSVMCVLCSHEMTVYDRYPLINGTFYLSHLACNVSTIEVEGKDDDPVFLSAVCLRCLSGSNKVSCSFCDKKWDGTQHQVGTMYYFDIFASFGCCSERLACLKCHQPVAEFKSLSFSQCSRRLTCPSCGVNDFHGAKSLNTFTVKTMS